VAILTDDENVSQTVSVPADGTYSEHLMDSTNTGSGMYYSVLYCVAFVSDIYILLNSSECRVLTQMHYHSSRVSSQQLDLDLKVLSASPFSSPLSSHYSSVC